jgi:hypothetical protein
MGRITLTPAQFGFRIIERGQGGLGSPIMGPTQEMVDELYREQIRRARATPPEQRLLDGIRLFEFSCRILMDGIRDQNPGADEARVRDLLAQRFDLLRRLEQVP